jgi:hypothetical protein
MFQNPFDGARAKIDRAHRHLAELVAAQSKYSSKQPLSITLEPQENGDTRVLAAIKTMPQLEHRAIVGDILGNLRASLDIATIQACVARGQKDEKLLGKTYFAFGGDEEDWWRNVRAKHSRMAGADQVIREAVASFKPWAEDGNALLYALKELVVEDKHVDLVPVGAGAGELSIEGLKFKRDDGELTRVQPRKPEWGSHQPVELLTVCAPSKVEISGPTVLKAFFGFGDVNGVRGKPVIPTLNEMGVMCQTIVDTLEAAANGK